MLLGLEGLKVSFCCFISFNWMAQILQEISGNPLVTTLHRNGIYTRSGWYFVFNQGSANGNGFFLGPVVWASRGTPKYQSLSSENPQKSKSHQQPNPTNLPKKIVERSAIPTFQFLYKPRQTNGLGISKNTLKGWNLEKHLCYELTTNLWVFYVCY